MAILELRSALGRGGWHLLRTCRELRWWLCRCGGPVPRGLRGDVLESRPAEWRPAPMPGGPGGQAGPQRRAAGRSSVRGPCWMQAMPAALSRSWGRKGCQEGDLEGPSILEMLGGWRWGGDPAGCSPRGRRKVHPVLASTPRRCCSSAPFFKVMGKISVNAATNSEP